MSSSATLDLAHVWHPFTQMAEWGAPGSEPLVLVGGEGAELIAEDGQRYLDGNSSIWTNLHGHRRPEIDAAIRAQLDRLAHCSFLGQTNDVAPALAAELVRVSGLARHRVFFSDDGSTAMEAALKMAHQARAQRGETRRTVFLSLGQAYHGDTIGAMSAGHSPTFHATYRNLLFPTREVMSPACYRCPANRAAPQRGIEARAARLCAWECLGRLEAALDELGDTASALILEPRVQGAAGLTMHPPGYLRQAAALCRARGVWLILDEVMTGFGRTGPLFAFQNEGVTPDLLALAKGLTAGYLPLAATLAAPEIFDAFLGTFAERRTFFHGHSYTGNPLGCAAARANLAIFEQEQTVQKNEALARALSATLARFWRHPQVGDVRCEGLIGAVELVADFATRTPFPWADRIGHRVCTAARAHGLLTRPVGDVLVLMPPYCTTPAQLERMGAALWQGLVDVLGAPGLPKKSPSS